MNLYTRFVITAMSYVFFGIGSGAQLWAIKAGESLLFTLTIYLSSFAFFIIWAFTGANKLKEAIKEFDKKNSEPHLDCDTKIIKP